ncbi:hypothetical protein HPP92_012347 [Vanilla planifolia]|uniref:Uncharacterized protein n=1 Tax=Vanilla planifolia TaxID=51239 RepID=A0A835QTL1_VANPL|nr:hypothetical protein HPP92_012347 [Vanilla planifolia]
MLRSTLWYRDSPSGGRREGDVVAGAEPRGVAPEFLVGHICELVETEFVGNILALVELVDIPCIILEDIEAFLLLIEVPRHRVVAPPPLVEAP